MRTLIRDVKIIYGRRCGYADGLRSLNRRGSIERKAALPGDGIGYGRSQAAIRGSDRIDDNAAIRGWVGRDGD